MVKGMDSRCVESGPAPLPRFGFGYSAAIRADRTSVALCDFNGRFLYQRMLRDSEGTVLRVHDAAPARDGRLAVAASALRLDGATQPVLGFLDAGGGLTRIVTEHGFASFRIRYSESGELWALAGAKGSHLIRVYNSDGRLSRELLGRDEFAQSKHASADGLLIGGAASMAVWLPELRAVVEFSCAGQELGRWVGLDIPASYDMLTAVMPAKNLLWVQALTPNPGVFRLDLNAAKPQLERIAEAETSALLGIHEGQVVRFGKGQFWVQK